jgi:ABC-type nitrate/sulfonate/bicarbonate transport system ATPase subunit
MDHLTKLPGEASGCMKKRADLARAMVTEPEILFDDALVVTAQKERARLSSTSPTTSNRP